jgi:hypothetical protein
MCLRLSSAQERATRRSGWQLDLRGETDVDETKAVAAGVAVNRPVSVSRPRPMFACVSWAETVDSPRAGFSPLDNMRQADRPKVERLLDSLTKFRDESRGQPASHRPPASTGVLARLRQSAASRHRPALRVVTGGGRAFRPAIINGTAGLKARPPNPCFTAPLPRGCEIHIPRAGPFAAKDDEVDVRFGGRRRWGSLVPFRPANQPSPSSG